MPSAHHGWATASATMLITPTSSDVLTMVLLNGSGEVLTAILVPAFTRWLISAVEPPTAPAASSGSDPLPPASSAATTEPATGRITVWAASQAESTYGILSATASNRNSTPAVTSKSVRCSDSGTSSVRPVAPNRPRSRTTA